MLTIKRARLEANGVDAITVALMNGHLNGGHERRVAEIAAEVLPVAPVWLSHEVLPEMQECTCATCGAACGRWTCRAAFRCCARTAG